jgi:hypothetical protein
VQQVDNASLDSLSLRERGRNLHDRFVGENDRSLRKHMDISAEAESLWDRKCDLT